jgi:hypothetical protein
LDLRDLVARWGEGGWRRGEGGWWQGEGGWRRGEGGSLGKEVRAAGGSIPTPDGVSGKVWGSKEQRLGGRRWSPTSPEAVESYFVGGK